MLECCASDSYRLCCNSQATIVERLHGIDEALRLVTEEILRRHAHVVEGELHGRRCAEPQLVSLLADFESGEIRRDDERSDSPRPASRAGRVRAGHGENRSCLLYTSPSPRD